MNKNLKEVNEIISLCDEMLAIVGETGRIVPTNDIYRKYKEKMYVFCRENNLIDRTNASYVLLEKSNSSLNPRLAYLNKSELLLIRRIIVDLKHKLFANNYEKIFISHREMDKAQVEAFIELLHAIGIPRQTVDENYNYIFCSSAPAHNIHLDEANIQRIKQELQSEEHTFCILWYTDNYFESQACLNEAGAIWILDKHYQEILIPNFNKDKINGLLDSHMTWMLANDSYRLNELKEKIEKMFNLNPISLNEWEKAKTMFIHRIKELS